MLTITFQTNKEPKFERLLDVCEVRWYLRWYFHCFTNSTFLYTFQWGFSSYNVLLSFRCLKFPPKPCHCLETVMICKDTGYMSCDRCDPITRREFTLANNVALFSHTRPPAKYEYSTLGHSPFRNFWVKFFKPLWQEVWAEIFQPKLLNLPRLWGESQTSFSSTLLGKMNR